ncbi:hypothetical protein C1N80_06210 [Brachybacterium sp. SGAir0954]|uniref:hypothetical protein n=1 Tax=Brachybacterium sp. SGAir0954 TaxID=2571029 RepID=UPI0010CD699C|nr:hypothetical protein [Brachybacterium sp. SGAir0954]QCR53214.1 hypothetical protein C1N80_06210 [Brachybacterium sp. SGAir0954]
MADEQTTEAPEATQEQQGEPAEQLGEGGKKALDAERKRAADAEKRVKALEAQLEEKANASLSEAELMQKQIEALSAKYEAAQQASLRDRVAVSEQIPEGLIGYLTGSTEDDIRDSAKQLKAAIAEAAKPGTPAPDPSQGAHGASSGGSTADKFAQFFAERINN